MHAKETREAFGVLLENDSFLGEDGNYTGGLSLTYESDALGKGNMQVDFLFHAWSDVVEGSVPRSRYAGMHFTWFL